MNTYWTTLWNALRGRAPKDYRTGYVYPSETVIKLDDKAIARAANRGATKQNDKGENE